MFIDISKPLGNVVEGLGVGDIVDQHNAHGSPVVGGGDRVKSFLTYKNKSESAALGQFQNN